MQVLKNGSLSVSPNFLEGFAESSILQYRLHNKSSRQTNYVAILPSPKRRCQHAGFLIHVVRAAKSANQGDFRCCRETNIQQLNSVDTHASETPEGLPETFPETSMPLDSSECCYFPKVLRSQLPKCQRPQVVWQSSKSQRTQANVVLETESARQNNSPGCSSSKKRAVLHHAVLCSILINLTLLR
jgi:hypothetical protein